MADQCIVCLENLDCAIPLQPLQGDDNSGGINSSSSSTNSNSGAASGSDSGGPTTTSHSTTTTNQQLLTDLPILPLAPASPNTASTTTENATTTARPHESEDNIAVIQVCGHTLHDTCLKAWTGKANSCPICRQAFHLVEVYDKIGGTLLNTYQVEDKKQVAEFDPLAWLDENPEEEEEARPCIVCNSAEHEDLTLLCDGCDTPYHTHCIGLDGVPEGSWLCMECADRNSYALPFSRPRAPGQRARGRRAGFFPRTQASMRNERTRARTDQWLGAWGQFSSHILGASGIDLDSNDDGDDGLGEYRRSQQLRERERREWQRWQQRLRIASRLGAGDVFARNIQDGVDHHQVPPQQAPPQQPPAEETREERQAWRDFERARAATPGARKRKSRSVTASPVEPAPEPTRPLKRPRTRRIAVQTEAGPSRAASTAAASSSHHYQSNRTTTTAGPSSPAAAAASPPEEAPSFLSSLLKEVEQTASSDDETVRSLFGLPQPVDPSSPVTSPSASTRNSPRAMSLTPPPQPQNANAVATAARSASRSPGLSSHIEPCYPPANYSPTRSNGESSDSESRKQQTNGSPPELRQPRPRREFEVRLPRSQDVSPTRSNNNNHNIAAAAALSLEIKQNISQVVRAALKPHWHTPNKKLSNDQYATINRNVTHRIYEEVKDPTAVDDEAKRHWEKIASSEVARAVAELKS